MTSQVACSGVLREPTACHADRAARRRFLIAGGGTGGHVTPALALGEVLAARGESVLFLGAERGLETRLVPEAGFELVTLPSRQLVRVGALSRLIALASLPATLLRALRVLRQMRPDLVISVGGYAAAPAVLAAALLRVPLVVVEPNALPGRANRLAMRFAARIFVGFESTAAVLSSGRRASRIRCGGIPLRRAMREAFGKPPVRRAPAPPFRLLVFGGSQGARQLNEAMMEAAAALHPAGLEVFHQSGPADRERVAAAYARAEIEAEVVAFEPNMPKRYRWADVALCRAGALSLAELALAGLPAVLVPLPHAADDHQRVNARQRSDAGAAVMLDPHHLDPKQLAATLLALFEKPERLVAMQRSAAALARPRAAEEIVQECQALLASREGRG